MTAYLGPAGNLVAFRCPSDEQISLADSVSLSRTLGGVQKAQYGRRAPRAWQVGIGTATPGELGQLMGLMQGLYGPPPWTYVGPWAQVTNLLTPAQSMLLPGAWSGTTAVQGGPVLLEGDLRPAQSVVIADGSAIGVTPLGGAYVPVMPGMRVTASAWVAGSPAVSLSLQFSDAEDSGVSTATTQFQVPADGVLKRRSISTTVPARAVTARLLITGALRVAQPAVTWTPDMAPWSVGGGVPKVIARGLSEAVQLAVRDQAFLRRSSASLVLEEVGNA